MMLFFIVFAVDMGLEFNTFDPKKIFTLAKSLNQTRLSKNRFPTASTIS